MYGYLPYPNSRFRTAFDALPRTVRLVHWDYRLRTFHTVFCHHFTALPGCCTRRAVPHPHTHIPPPTWVGYHRLFCCSLLLHARVRMVADTTTSAAMAPSVGFVYAACCYPFITTTAVVRVTTHRVGRKDIVVDSRSAGSRSAWTATWMTPPLQCFLP